MEKLKDHPKSVQFKIFLASFLPSHEEYSKHIPECKKESDFQALEIIFKKHYGVNVHPLLNKIVNEESDILIKMSDMMTFPNCFISFVKFVDLITKMVQLVHSKTPSQGKTLGTKFLMQYKFAVCKTLDDSFKEFNEMKKDNEINDFVNDSSIISMKINDWKSKEVLARIGFDTNRIKKKIDVIQLLKDDIAKKCTLSIEKIYYIYDLMSFEIKDREDLFEAFRLHTPHQNIRPILDIHVVLVNGNRVLEKQ